MLWPTMYARTWNPLAEMERLQREMNRLFDTAGNERVTTEYPAVNIWTCPDKALLTAELPGVEPATLENTVKNDTVTIRGNRKEEALPEGHTYLRRERGSGAFVRSFALPFRVEAGKVQAHYQTGILQVTLPRADEDLPKKIAVSTT